MQYRCDQSSSVPDFDLKYADGTMAVVEVTASVDEDLEKTTAAISSERKGGPFIATKKCQNSWCVHPLPDANVNKIRKHVDEYLAKVALEELHRFFVYEHAADFSSVARIWNDLRIEAGSVTKWKTPNCIGIFSPVRKVWLLLSMFRKLSKLRQTRKITSEIYLGHV